MKFKSRQIVCFILLMLAPTIVFSKTLKKMASKFEDDIKDLNVKIAVMDFSSSGAEKDRNSFVVRERLTTFLAQNKNVTLIERALLEKVLQEQKIQLSGAVSLDTAKKIGELTGADAIISGTISELLTDEIEINARVIRVGTGEILSAAQAIVNKDWKYFKPLGIIEDGRVVADSAQDYYRRGSQYHKESKYGIALDFYNKAIKLKPDYPDAYCARGIVCALKGKYDEAIVDFTSAIDLKLDFTEAYLNRGLAREEVDDTYDGAMDDYNKAIELDPLSVHAYILRGCLYKKKYNFVKIFQKNPDLMWSAMKPEASESAEMIGNHGLIELKRKAISDCTKAIELDPKSAQGYLARGRIYDEEKEYDNAIVPTFRL